MTCDTTEAVTTVRPGSIKCVVWDADNTLWHGTLIEGDDVVVRPEVVDELRRLDHLGVLHSLASRNDHDMVLDVLRTTKLADYLPADQLGADDPVTLDEYFLYPHVNWGPKHVSISAIATALNIATSAIAFVDDQAFERGHVARMLPDVTTVDSADLGALRGEAFTPPRVTNRSRRRRLMYRTDVVRQDAQRDYAGTDDAFLATTDLRMTIWQAGEDDLKDAVTLTERTNQLNATGKTFSYDELDALRQSPDHLLLLASLRDCYGDYDTIGLALIERGNDAWQLHDTLADYRDAWRLHLLLMSCRVESRGVGAVLLSHVMTLARAAGTTLLADFVDTGRNRKMAITYRLVADFRDIYNAVGGNRQHVLLHSDLTYIPSVPSYLTIEVQP